MDPSQKLVATIEAQKLFVSEIGLITRNKAPLNVLGMKKVSLEMKKDMALGLQFMFDVDLTDPDIWKFINDHMHSTYKEWKAKLHRHYKQYASDPALARETPPPEKIFGTRRTLEEWHYLVDTLYTNEQYQEGSRPFLKHMEAAREKGENPTYISNWNNMHMLKGKSMWINEAAEIKGKLKCRPNYKGPMLLGQIFIIPVFGIFLFVLLLLSGDAQKDLIRSKKMNEEYEKAKQQVAESSGTPLDQVSLPIPQQLEIMTGELGVAKGKRIRGLGSSLRVESLHSCGFASSCATEQKVEELQSTVGELKGTVSELQGTVGKLLDVIEWMRTHDGPLPSHLFVPSQHVGDSPCHDDQGNSGGSRNVYEDLDDIGNSH
ncbi:unnamed protein product [Prunus armeniaca]|uniref:Uncharacterized protein n=1 Tax=Prunus armeniaca TaxID=36596 RepID=A0A6J5V6T7_PRUAR|nr:unnamed protein product [Prunus armeniaca]